MKRVQRFLNCVSLLIKKKFFNSEKSEIYHECEKVLNFADNKDETDDLFNNKEYIENYNVTTRWQTI